MRRYTWGVIPLSTCMHLYMFWITPSIPSVAHVLNGWPISQKTTFEYRVHWNINVRKRDILFTKKKNQKNCSTMSVMLWALANFAKKNSCVVARIVPYYTAGLHLLTFHILEPYPSKDIALGLSHVISH